MSQDILLQKAKLIGEALDRYFPDPKPTLIFYSPFTLLVAVILSAQCKDERVNIATEKLFALADTPKKMAQLPTEDIYNCILQLGLAKNKAKFLSSMSKQIVERFAGKVPENFHDLESLPGVGHKTASVVMAQAFNAPAFPVDTHIFRLARRWGLSDSNKVEGVEEDLKRLFPSSEWNKRHIQIINCGRKFCKATGHKIENCPFCQLLNN